MIAKLTFEIISGSLETLVRRMSVFVRSSFRRNSRNFSRREQAKLVLSRLSWRKPGRRKYSSKDHATFKEISSNNTHQWKVFVQNVPNDHVGNADVFTGVADQKEGRHATCEELKSTKSARHYRLEELR